MTQNPHMKKNIDLREQEMLMNITSKRFFLKNNEPGREGKWRLSFPPPSLWCPPVTPERPANV